MTEPLKKITIIADLFRGSYKEIAELYYELLKNDYLVKLIETPRNPSDREKLSSSNSDIYLHITIGDDFIPITGGYNIAQPWHEWTLYPTNWIKLLNEFDEIWTASEYVKNLLLDSQLTRPAYLIPPSLENEKIPQKTNWEITNQKNFFFIGEPHFRKGHHFLINGFLNAFPECNKAKLTIKTSAKCHWNSPREDIILIKEKWSRKRLLREYARHDCFISASLGEGLGLPLAEAIMAGLPVCTNFWGGHKSIVKSGGFVEIKHEEIIQPFTSNPAFYSEGQKCAYSSPQEIAKSIKVFINTSMSERKKMAFAAKKNFLKTYGRENTLKNIHSRILEISKK